MSFSAVTCLSYTGTTPLGGVLNLYSDIDSFTTAFQTNINLSAITGNECPYYINNVPDGTTQIRIYDIGTGCYCDLPVQNNNLCVTCDLDFNSYSANTIGRLVAGNLTGSCQANITDYRIFWYETGDTTNPVYISGKGTEFTPYSFTHPLTGASAIFAQEGTYRPVIDKIKLSGLTFSQTGGTGFIPAELDCFTETTVTVDAFTCSNGTTSNNPNYTHRVNFLGAGLGSSAVPLESTFLLTGITNYFAWQFNAFAVTDRLRLTYYGSAYTEPLIIEDMVFGTDLPISNFNLNTLPKSADTSWSFYVKKVTCLTGLTRNVGDRIKIEVIPNTVNPQTNWDFYFTCLNTFNQNPCIINKSPYKIITSSITSVTGGCNTNTINFTLDACNFGTDDFTNYMVANINGNIMTGTRWGSPNAFTFNRGATLTMFTNFVQSTILKSNLPPTCNSPNSNVIKYSKYVSGTTGIIDIEFSDISDFNAYYNSYLSVHNSVKPGSLCNSGPFSGTPFDPTDIRYYRYYTLAIPKNTGTSNCGDPLLDNIYSIHPSSDVTTGTTGPNYTLRITMPRIVNGLIYDDPICNVSGSVQTVVNLINSSIDNYNFTGTTLTGSRYLDPFYGCFALCSGATNNRTARFSGQIFHPKYLNETIVYTGTTPTMVPNLSGKTFDFTYPRFSEFTQSNNLTSYIKDLYRYNIFLNNTSDVRDFQILRVPFTGGTEIPPVNTDIVIYSYTGATSAYTIHDPTYFI